jgi:hypothetical protein
MLDVLADNVNPTLRVKHQAAHQRLAKMTQVVTDKAAVYGQKMDLLLAQWQEFNARLSYVLHYLMGKLSFYCRFPTLTNRLFYLPYSVCSL